MRTTIPVLVVSVAVCTARIQAQTPKPFRIPVFGQAPSPEHPLTELPLPTLRTYDLNRFDVATSKTCPMPVLRAHSSDPMPVAKGGPTEPMPVLKSGCTNPLDIGIDSKP